jgi:hypothetical protein
MNNPASPIKDPTQAPPASTANEINTTPPTQQPVQVQSIKESPKFSPRILIGLLFLLTLILVFGTYLFLASNKQQALTSNPYEEQENLPPETEITDWITYKNDEHGFEFKYPNDITLSAHLNNLTLKREFISDTKFYNRNFWLNVIIEEHQSKESVESYFTSKYCETIKGTAYTLSVESAIKDCKDHFLATKAYIDIDERKSLRARNIYYSTERLITIVGKHPLYLHFLLGEAGEEGSGISEEAIKTLDQILSTFKFINNNILASVKYEGGLCPPGIACTDLYEIDKGGNITKTKRSSARSQTKIFKS